MSEAIRIFSRIPPESKAAIIRAYKKQHETARIKSQSKFAEFLKINRLKIGMCGDGANDLLALREADLSIGVQETDASYGSSFTIKSLSSVYEVIREAKCAKSSMIQLYQYYATATFTDPLVTTILITAKTYLS